MGIISGCKPRKEVLKGDLADAIFAADFGDLIAGKAPPVYGDSTVFFQNTHPAKQLCKVVQAVFARLADGKEGGATLRLSTGFGGGKTHALMALWHLANNIDDLSIGTELLPAAGRPKKVHIAAIDAGKGGVPEFTSHGKTKVQSLWGELFRQLDIDNGLKLLGRADNPESSPSDKQIESVFPKGPVLILLDELVIYMAKLSDRGQGNLLGFINSLAAVVSKRPQTVLIITDPGGQAAYATQSAKLGAAVQSAATKLDDVTGRKFTDFDPIGDESAKVIVRRLLEKVDATLAQKTSAAYHALYERVLREAPGAVTAECATMEYARKVVECYPFHPRLLLTAQGHLQALQSFQKSRGVLRLFARIIRDAWESKRDVDLITAGEVNWSGDGIQGDLLTRLDRAEFKAAITADVAGHAVELDGGKADGVHHRVASAILLESITLGANSGLEPADLTLAVLRPDEAGPEPVEAMDRLMGVCWHTYPTTSGKGCQFRFEPNVLKQIEQRKNQIPIEDAKSRVLAEAQGYFSGMTFKVANWPTSAKQVPESATLQLALCETVKIAKAICAFEDDSDPAAPMPRRFQNAILAVTATPTTFEGAVEKAQRMLAAMEIEKENKGDSGKMVRDQLKKISPELHRQFAIQTRRAFDVVVLPGGAVGHIDEQYQVPDDQILQKAYGQSSLKRFLEAKELVYQPGACLDSHLFVREVLPGATPLADKPGVFTAKAVHERFLAAPKLRLIPDSSIVRNTTLKAVEDGKIAIRLPDGRAYDAQGCIEGSEGKRRRTPDVLTSFPLDDSVLVTTIGSEEASAWLKEDKPGKPTKGGGPGGGPSDTPPPPPPLGKVSATNWDKVLEYAHDRPLLELHLVASSPADAAMIQQAVQPLGADQLSVSVSVGGSLKDGGSMNFAANDLKPTHPAKPLGMAQTIFNSLQSGSQFEVDLKLTFGASGRTGMRSAMEQARDKIPEGVSVRGLFDKPEGGK
jgi:Protein of unknown function (DUF499)